MRCNATKGTTETHGHEWLPMGQTFACALVATRHVYKAANTAAVTSALQRLFVCYRLIARWLGFVCCACWRPAVDGPNDPVLFSMSLCAKQHIMQLLLYSTLGWVAVDNIKANWRVLLVLQEEHPTWIMQGCFALHVARCSRKAFAKLSPTTGRVAGARSFGMR
jgi:hypothetical protein